MRLETPTVSRFAQLTSNPKIYVYLTTFVVYQEKTPIRVSRDHNRRKKLPGKGKMTVPEIVPVDNNLLEQPPLGKTSVVVGIRGPEITRSALFQNDIEGTRN